MRSNQRQDSHHEREKKEFEEKMISVSRVSKKTKGGNKMGFSVLMVVGDRKGRVGVGLGKAGDVSSAMKKGVKKAKKKMITVPLRGTTIPFAITLKTGAGKVMLKPAPKGSGIIAGGPVRAVVDAAGIRDISSKIMGSSNQSSSVYATFAALKEIHRLVTIRGLSFGKPANTSIVEVVVAAKSVDPTLHIEKKVPAHPVLVVKSKPATAPSQPAANKPALMPAAKPAVASVKAAKAVQPAKK